MDRRDIVHAAARERQIVHGNAGKIDLCHLLVQATAIAAGRVGENVNLSLFYLGEIADQCTLVKPLNELLTQRRAAIFCNIERRAGVDD